MHKPMTAMPTMGVRGVLGVFFSPSDNSTFISSISSNPRPPARLVSPVGVCAPLATSRIDLSRTDPCY